jgi:hypothetical protein
MQTYFISVLVPLAAGGTLVHVYRVEHSAGLQWTREHADEIAQRAHGAGYVALMVREALPDDETRAMSFERYRALTPCK